MDQDMNEEMASENVDSDSEVESRGYCIEVYVRPNGSFSISGPTYKDEQEIEDGQDAESLPDTLKLILQTVKENPVGNDANGEMEAGFMAGPAGKKPMSHY